MTIIYENMTWMKLTHLFSNLALNLKARFCTFTFTSKLTFQNIHTQEKQYISIAYTMYINALSNIPLTLTLDQTLYEESTPVHGNEILSWMIMFLDENHLLSGSNRKSMMP